MSLSVASAVALAGCSQSEPGVATTAKVSPSAPAAEQPLDPQVASAIGSTTNLFMRAILSGDATSAAKQLTARGLQRYQSDPSVLALSGMQVENLVVGEIRLLSPSEAAAQCLVSEAGSTAPQELCCLLKLEPAGWRVCGVACETGGEGPAVISFEEEPAAPATQFVEAPDEIWNSVPRTATAPSTGEIR